MKVPRYALFGGDLFYLLQSSFPGDLLYGLNMRLIPISHMLLWISLPLIAPPFGIGRLRVDGAAHLRIKSRLVNGGAPKRRYVGSVQFSATTRLRIDGTSAPLDKRSIGYFPNKIANNLRRFVLDIASRLGWRYPS